MAFDYSFTDAAKADLDEILSYISSDLANPTAASSFFDNIEKTISQLVEFPKSGTVVKNEFVTVENIRKVPIGNYTLYYTPDSIPSTIVIIRIIYAKRSPEWISSQLNHQYNRADSDTKTQKSTGAVMIHYSCADFIVQVEKRAQLCLACLLATSIPCPSLSVKYYLLE